MENKNKRVQFTSQVIAEKTALRGWWKGLLSDRVLASKWAERAIAGTLGEEKVKKMMKHFRKKMVREAQEALWDDMEMRSFNVSSKTKFYMTVDALSEEDAVMQVAQHEAGLTETVLNAEGVEWFKWEALACLLKADGMD